MTEEWGPTKWWFFFCNNCRFGNKELLETEQGVPLNSVAYLEKNYCSKGYRIKMARAYSSAFPMPSHMCKFVTGIYEE